MPRTHVGQNPSGVNLIWLIIASILLVMALGAVLYFLSGNGFNTESFNRPATIQLQQSIDDSGQTAQWV